MGYFKTGLLASVISLMGIAPVWAESCQKTVVISREGYSNVRSSPSVNSHNIIGTLVVGFSVQPVRHQSGWHNISSPLRGWIKSNQIAILSCDRAHNLLLKEGLKALEGWQKQAIAGHRQSAEIFLRMSPGVDGVVADGYLGLLADWARKNPAFLISILQGQSVGIRRSVLNSLDIGLSSTERGQFERYLQTLSAKNTIVQEWKKLSPSF